jgi:hypothetical protein
MSWYNTQKGDEIHETRHEFVIKLIESSFPLFY